MPLLTSGNNCNKLHGAYYLKTVDFGWETINQLNVCGSVIIFGIYLAVSILNQISTCYYLSRTLKPANNVRNFVYTNPSSVLVVVIFN